MKTSLTLCLTTLTLLTWTAATAQRSTEVYIPIGESPGVSDSESIVGVVSDVEHTYHHMTISTAGESKTVTLTEKTLFYIDSSGQKKRNTTGGVEDCEVGRRIEAYVNDDGEAVWVKILAAE